MDFDALLRESAEDLPIEPRDLYDQLPGKAQGYGYLRDVQAQVLEPWHAKRYPVNQAATPIMVHPSRKLHHDATAPAGMRVITPRVLGDLKVAVRGLSEGLAAQGWADADVVNRLVTGHDLTPSGLKARLAGPTGGTA